MLGFRNTTEKKNPEWFPLAQFDNMTEGGDINDDTDNNLMNK